MAESKRYQVGRDFTITITAPDLGPTDYLVAEFSGPIGDDDLPQTVLRTREDPKKPKGRERDEFVLRGPVPETAQPGDYCLTRLIVVHGVGRRQPQEYPPDALPEAWIVIEPYYEPSSPLPKITKIE